jgi:WD40 repeat protein
MRAKSKPYEQERTTTATATRQRLISVLFALIVVGLLLVAFGSAFFQHKGYGLVFNILHWEQRLAKALASPTALIIFTRVLAAIITAGVIALFKYLFTRIQNAQASRCLENDPYTTAAIKQDALTDLRTYVPPDCQSNDPASGQAATDKKPVFQEIDWLLGPPVQVRFALLLADSGMGKSAFLGKYYVRHWRKLIQKKHFSIMMVPLIDKNANELINAAKLQERSQTVLFLDGLDEDAVAGSNFESRFNELLRFAEGFRSVLITCRTQFLADMNCRVIPGQVTFNSSGGTTGGVGGGPSRQVHVTYLSPFSKKQIRKYLSLRFPFYSHPWLRRKSLAAVRRFSDLVARPLLLTYIRDIASAQTAPRYSSEIYDIIVDQWLEREAKKKYLHHDKESMLHFCEKFAEELFHRGVDRIPSHELDSIASSYLIELDAREVRERSLLHYDTVGNWKFAHPSIMEYLIVRAHTEDHTTPIHKKSWTHEMRNFAREMLISGKINRLLHADLREVNLCNADLTGVVLRGSDLSRADLSNAVLDGANLIDVALSGAYLDETSFRATNASGVSGLTFDQAMSAHSDTKTVWPCRSLKMDPYSFLSQDLSVCALSHDGELAIIGNREGKLQAVNTHTGKISWTLRAHLSAITACVVLPNGKSFVSASSDGKLKIWDLATLSELFVLRGHKGAIYDCAVSPRGNFIASFSRDQTMKIWNPSNGALLNEFARNRADSSTASIDGEHIIIAAWDHLEVWHIQNGFQYKLAGGPDKLFRCGEAHHGELIFGVSKNFAIGFWERTSKKYVKSFEVTDGSLYSCIASLDGELIVSAGYRDLNVWSVRRKQKDIDLSKIRSLTGHKETVESCSITPHNDVIASLSKDDVLKVWDIHTGIQRLSTSPTVPITCCAADPNGEWVLTGFLDGTLIAWTLDKGQEAFKLVGHSESISACRISPQLDVIVSASHDGTVKVWDLKTKMLRFTFEGHGRTVQTCAISVRGGFIASGSAEGKLYVWNVATGKIRNIFPGHSYGVMCCAADPRGEFVVSGSGKELSFWDVAFGNVGQTFVAHNDMIYACDVSPDGNLIVSASQDHTVKLWDRRTKKERLTFTGHTATVMHCEFSSDSQFVLSASRGLIKVWDVKTGEERLTLPCALSCATFGHNNCIISVCSDRLHHKTIKVWFPSADNT